MITERNKPNAILTVVVFNLFILNMIKAENIVISNKYKGNVDNFNNCRLISVSE